MKKISKIKLSALAGEELKNSEMNFLRGGDFTVVCECSCYYKEKGGSSTEDNSTANKDEGKKSTHGEAKECTGYYNPDDTHWQVFQSA